MSVLEVMTFGHLEIRYDAEVLKPRPWTEEQSVWAAKLLADLPAGDVLELCAGVGHIGLLAVQGTTRHLVQVDASARACALARINAAEAGPAGRSVEVREGALEEALAEDERFVLVIADPPWVPSDDVASHPDDPTSAIDGGADGLDGVRACLDVVARHLTDVGAAVLQVGDREQVEAVREYVDQRPQLRLAVADDRILDQGALVHLARRPDGRLTEDARG